ncbi:hypothetical protein [Oleiagrimonas soli]|uniref:Uncharacterized protein n=1 Tax=Oleiagrimonas soli TaxID=1543381 RepID=A0A099CV90_9GAMM|nr:hypothetical protein [Oleiagrimonas soli]KGI76940.1 hypothetical protein LF63_0113590 [Oleiagrimonas soli]MBB6185188.1 hypothetical protein [Oleiagrimonas soli]
MNIRRSMLMGAVLVGCAALTVPAMAAKPTLDCKLSYSMTGWSIIYKHAEGKGVVTCANGTSMPVKIAVKGGGLTAGKWHIDNGKGKFTDVHTINDVLGRYAQAQAHAGVVKSGSAQVLTKGTVSLALAGTGEGVDLGVDVGAFTISRR